MSELTKNDVDSAVIDISDALNSESLVTPFDVRLALMDYADKNIPMYVEYLTDQQLWKCIEWGVGQFNSTPPIFKRKKYTAKNFPERKLLLDLAVVEALRLTALIELRGEMQYSDGGVQSTIYYKNQQFSALRQELESKTTQAITSLKRSLNLDDCYGYLC